MEDNRYPAEFLNVTEMMLARRSGSYVITKDARRAYIHGGSLVWQSVKSVEYFFSNIPGTAWSYFSLNNWKFNYIWEWEH